MQLVLVPTGADHIQVNLTETSFHSSQQYWNEVFRRCCEFVQVSI